jgi:hypothetical protein
MGYAYNGATAAEEDVWIRGLLFGDAKLGKTTIAGTFADPFVLTNNMEEGHKVFHGHDIDCYVCDSWEEMTDKLKWFCEKAAKQPGWYRTLVVDGLSFFTAMMADELTETHNFKDPRQLYGRIGTEMRAMVKYLHGAQKNRFHLIYTTHMNTQEEADDKGKQKIVGRTVMLEGRKWVALLPAAVDFIGCVKGATDTATAQRVVRTELAASPGQSSGMRFRGLPASIDNMDFPKLVNAFAKIGVKLGAADAGLPLSELLKVKKVG